MSDRVFIGCKLPCGLTIDHGGVSVTLGGSRSPGASSGFGVTPVDKDFWDAWRKSLGGGFAPLDSGAIFAVPTLSAAKGEAKSRRNVKTGLEGLNPNNPGPGIVPTDAMKTELEKVEGDEAPDA